MVTGRRVPVGAHYGWRDWLVQRVSAVVMAAYTVLILFLLLWFGGLDYAAWKAAFGEYAATTVYVDGPGTCPVSLDALDFAARPRPMYPFEPLTAWSAAL